MNDTIKNNQMSSITNVLITFAAGLIVIIGTRYIAQDLIAPILMAVFLSVLFFPIFKYFRGKGFSRGGSVSLMVLSFILSLVVIGWFLSYTFGVLSDIISEQVDKFNEALANFLSTIGVTSGTSDSATNIITEENITNLIGFLAGSLWNLLYYLLLIPMLAVLMVMQADSLPKSMTGDLVKENPFLQRFGSVAKSIMVYLSGRLKVNLFTGLLFSIACILLDIPSPFLWGLLVALMSFVPYIGIVIAGIPPTLIAFANGGVPSAVLVILAIAGINLLAENVIDPYVQGKGVKISTAAIVIALIFWTWLLGPLGAIMSVPLTVFIKLFLEDYSETRWISALMEGNYEKTQAELKDQKSTSGLRRFIPTFKGSTTDKKK